ncbi:28S ribosomal protein S6, mitochondrial [Patagioenas fasciata monilis]|uniref:Small ribosomal subunit protein bS6m n=2 Tax=Patagioenas fasciata TaxID=372321 RepID=A0A1V4J2N6_PATFA|nr:28S ribosomal protein S6, mitochondrial [Patagioenas fasciata monilis]
MSFPYASSHHVFKNQEPAKGDLQDDGGAQRLGEDIATTLTTLLKQRQISLASFFLEVTQGRVAVSDRLPGTHKALDNNSIAMEMIIASKDDCKYLYLLKSKEPLEDHCIGTLGPIGSHHILKTHPSPPGDCTFPTTQQFSETQCLCLEELGTGRAPEPSTVTPVTTVSDLLMVLPGRTMNTHEKDQQMVSVRGPVSSKMPRYELALILKAMQRPETAAVLKRTVEALMERGALVRNLENLGEKSLPYKISKHKERHRRGGYFLIDLEGPPSIVSAMMDHLGRDIDVIRRTFVKHPLSKTEECSGIIPVNHEDKLMGKKK